MWTPFRLETIGELHPVAVDLFIHSRQPGCSSKPPMRRRLGELCADAGLREKSWVHRFSAASCWARAGDFHTAIVLGAQLLAHPGLPPRLRQRVEDFTQSLRQRRVQWATGLALTENRE